MATADKYDRQLRLWGASGQRSLSTTQILLVGSSACGTESLKNLVLPGVGSFLILDEGEGTGDVVPGDAADLIFDSPASNFFGNGAREACCSLCELNPDVSGQYCIVPSLSSVDFNAFLRTLRRRHDNILVISADQPSPVFLRLSLACYSLSLPLVVVRSYGLLGVVRIQTPQPYHVVKDSKNPNLPPDLRLNGNIFDALLQVEQSVGTLEEMDSKEHSHVPYVILLLRALEEWRSRSSTPLPCTYAEKEEFRLLLRSMSKDYDNELNFQEGLNMAHLAWADGKISEESRAQLERVSEDEFYRHVVAENEASMEENYSKLSILQHQLMILALRRFLDQNDDHPPLIGTIPDMTSNTKTFVALQEAYRRQADIDRDSMTQHMRDILENCKSASNGKQVRVTMPPEDDVAVFCKSCRDLRVLETRPLYIEYLRQDPSGPVTSIMSKSLPSEMGDRCEAIHSEAREDLLGATMDPYETDPVHTPFLWWIAFRACDAFYDRHGHYPGKHDQSLALEADASEVHKLMMEVVDQLGLRECDFIGQTLGERGKDLAIEVVRYDEAEIHTVAAVVGGVASQEAVKLITGQYVPLNDTFVYNGIASTAGVYRF